MSCDTPDDRSEVQSTRNADGRQPSQAFYDLVERAKALREGRIQPEPLTEADEIIIDHMRFN